MNWVGKIIVGFLVVIGVVLFLSGLRFLNPLDTIFRLFFGGIVVCGTLRYYYTHRHHRA